MGNLRCAILVDTWQLVIAAGNGTVTVRMSEIKREVTITDTIKRHCPSGRVVLVAHTDLNIDYEAVTQAVAPNTEVTIVQPMEAIESLVNAGIALTVNCTQFTFKPDERHTLAYIDEQPYGVQLRLCSADAEGKLSGEVVLQAYSGSTTKLENLPEAVSQVLTVIKQLAFRSRRRTPSVLVAAGYGTSIGSALMAAMQRELQDSDGTVAFIGDPMAELAGARLIAQAS